MNAFSLREKLDLVHGNILNSITAQSIDESRLYASTLRHWAKLIDDYKKSRGGRRRRWGRRPGVHFRRRL